MAFLEGSFPPIAYLHYSAHVDLVKCREHCSRVLSLDQALSNGLSSPRKPYTLFAAPCLGLKCRFGWRRCSWNFLCRHFYWRSGRHATISLLQRCWNGGRYFSRI